MANSSELSIPRTEPDLATRRRAEILTGSIRVIARDGVVAAKLKDIARESGVSLGLVQHYFDTRDKLVDETFTVMMRAISQEAQRRLQGIEDPLELIYAMNALHVHGTIGFPERWGFWSELWAAAGRSEHLRGVSTQVYQLWAHPLEEALEVLSTTDRLPSGADPHRIATGVLALMDGLSIRTLADPEGISAEFMLQVLNDWVSTQLGVPPEVATRHVAALSHTTHPTAPRPLTPDVVAEALRTPHSTSFQTAT